MKIPSGWDLPDAFASRLGEGAGPQRAMIQEGQLLLVLHAVPAPGVSAREGVMFWRLDTGEWRASNGVIGLLALHNHVETYAAAVAELEAQFAVCTVAADYRETLKTIAPLARAVSNMDCALQSARAGLPEVHELIGLRDESSDLLRATELLQTGVKDGLDCLIASQNEELSRLTLQSLRAGERLNVLVAIFLPMIALSGVFGMRLPLGFQDSPGYIFAVVLFLASFFGLVLGLAIGRKK